jgi:opacity protein-like surface antigen
MNIAIAPPSQAHAPMTYRERRDEQRDQFIDATYVGALLGSATISDPGAGSATGLGVVLGTSLDDFLGIEFGYSFTKMDTRLDLPSRAGTSSAQNPANSTDSSLASHLVTAEFQAHLTDALKRLRPYAGLGLGWKSSTLQEELPPTYYAQNANASLSQTALGPVASAGTKFRLTPTFQLGFSFRYFLPLSRQTARLSADGDTRLRLSDAKLTGSAQHQVSGGLLYSF